MSKKIADFEKFFIGDTLLLKATFETLSSEYEEQIGVALMNLFYANEQDVPLMNICIPREINRTDQESLLFRGNSVYVFMLSEYARLNGLQYLKNILSNFMKKFLEKTDLSYEVDPTRLAKPETSPQNALNLLNASSKVLDLILESVNEIPGPIRDACRKLHDGAELKFPGSGYKIIGGFFFLRFICPALVAPKSIGIVSSEKGLTRDNRRGLILIAKILQAISNDAPPNDKEEYMRILNEFVAKNIDKVRKFYDSILKDNPKQSKLKRKPVTTDYTMTIMRYLSTNIERIKTMVKAAEFGEITTQKLNLYIEFVQEEEKEKEKKKASIIKNNIKILGRVKSSLPKIDEESNLENSMDHVSEGSEDLNKSVDSEKLEEGESFKKNYGIK